MSKEFKNRGMMNKILLSPKNNTSETTFHASGLDFSPCVSRSAGQPHDASERFTISQRARVKRGFWRSLLLRGFCARFTAGDSEERRSLTPKLDQLGAESGPSGSTQYDWVMSHDFLQSKGFVVWG